MSCWGGAASCGGVRTASTCWAIASALGVESWAQKRSSLVRAMPYGVPKPGS